MVWLLGRIYCTGTPEDYVAVHALQDKFSIVPLSPALEHNGALRRSTLSNAENSRIYSADMGLGKVEGVSLG